MVENIAFHLFREYSKVTSVQEITDDGAYKEGQAPEGKEFVLTTEVVHSITLVDAAGRIVVFEFDQPEALDFNGNTGGPVIRDGIQIKDGSGEPTIQTTRLSTILDPNLKTKAEKMLGVMEQAPGGGV